MAGVIPVIPRFKFTNSSGVPIVSGTVTVYLAGTTTLANTYQDKELTTANTNPVSLDANGEALFWVDPSYTYKFLLKDATGATVSGWPVDNIPGSANLTDVASAIATAKAAALADIATAQADADEALALAAAAIANTGEAVIDALIDDEENAIAIDATASEDYMMKVVDAANPLNNQVGDLLTILGTSVFPRPKMVIDTDRRTVVWSPHNFAKQTSTPGSNVSGVTVTTGQTDSDGGAEAALITATSTTFAAFHQTTLGSSDYNGCYYMIEWIVRAGTAAYIYLAFNDGSYRHAYFNASTWATGTVDSGVTAASYATRADGTALPSGYRRLTAYYKTSTNTVNMTCGMCDADASKNVTSGRTMYGEKPFLHLGVQSMDYFENTGSTLRVGVPIDYSKGGARILPEPASTYNSLYADDLTNAAWTKTNITAALTTTGPHGEACSTLTATAGDGTCLQTTASAVARQMFSAFVRRRTGTGSIWMTTNNGSNWTEITSSLNSSTYTRFSLAGVASPTVGFKITTSGDAIDVALALNATSGYLSSPRPVYGTSGSRNADVFAVPVTLLTAGTAWTVFADYDRGSDTRYEDTNAVRLGNTAFTQELTQTTDQSTGALDMTAKDGTTTKNYDIWSLTSGERMQLTMKAEDNEHVMSINGEPPGWITTVNMPTVEQLKLAHSAPLYLRRLLIVPRAVDKDDVRTWRWSGTATPSAVVAWDSDTDFANSTMNRSPSVTIISDDGATADAIVFWGQKHDTGHHTEAPARIMQRKFRFNKAAGTVTALSAAAVTYQQAGWASGTGHLQSAHCFVVPSGANAGRLVLLFSALEVDDFTPDQRSVYVMTNDADGDPTQWSAPTQILAAASGEYRLVDPSGSGLILPPTHSVAPNRMIAMVIYGGGSNRAIYSDDFGATWTVGNAFTPAIAIDESNLSMWPDGTLVATSRITTASTARRNYATSTDGGVTFTDQGVITGYAYDGGVSAGLTQLDPTGATSSYGKLLLSHPSDASSRKGMIVHRLTDATLTLGDTVTPFASASTRYYGYSSIKSLFGGSHFALAVEGGSVPFNTDNTVYLAMVEAP